MPELPDVEHFKRYLDATALHQRIERTHLNAPELVKEIEPATLRRHLTGHTLESTRRHGKYLFADLGDDHHLMMHFGMTGDLHYYQDDAEPPYTQLLLDFDNGYHLAYTAPRKLGGLGIVQDIDDFVAAHDLGPDALAISEADFCSRARERRGGVKSWLMDQSSIAGVGNIYTDEILFQAGMHPEQEVKLLTDKEVHTLYSALKTVLETAIEARADPAQLPDGYLLKHREEGVSCPRCSGSIETIDVGGRTAYYCPKCQKKHG